MEDNFYQTSSEKLFPKSDKTIEKAQKAKREYEKEAPIIAETIERFKQQKEAYGSVYAVKEEKNPENFMREIAINKRVAAILDAEIQRLEGIVKTYGKNAA